MIVDIPRIAKSVIVSPLTPIPFDGPCLNKEGNNNNIKIIMVWALHVLFLPISQNTKRKREKGLFFLVIGVLHQWYCNNRDNPILLSMLGIRHGR